MFEVGLSSQQYILNYYEQNDKEVIIKMNVRMILIITKQAPEEDMILSSGALLLYKAFIPA